MEESNHEHSFVEEETPEGKTILNDCLGCGLPAGDAIKELKSERKELQEKLATAEKRIAELEGR